MKKLAPGSVILALICAWASPVQGKPLESPLYRYLQAQANRSLSQRERLVGSLVDAASLEARRDWVRAAILDSFGGLPRETPLNPKTLWSRDFDGYRVEGVIYESQPGFFVTANFYLPTAGTPPFPAVLGPCGHSDVGKAAETYQCAWINLAKRGFAVLSFDPIGQGERNAFLTPEGVPRFGPTTEHTLLGVQVLLIGSNIARDFIWDGIRSIDYLCSRPEVDPNRIGCTGNSGGGTQTAYLMAIDRRIAAAAPSCYLTTFERLIDTIGTQDAEQNFVGQIARGIDHADYVEACLPRPVLICAASDDYFDIDGTWKTFREAKNFYQRYGVPERVDIIEAPDEHGFSVPRRTRVYHWMAQWLKGEVDTLPEPPTQVQPPENLSVTASGQVATSIEGARSLQDLYREKAISLRQNRNLQKPDSRHLRENLREVLRLPGNRSTLEWKQESGQANDIPERTLLHAETESGWNLQAEWIRPEDDSSDQAVLWLGDSLSDRKNPMDFVEEGYPVLVHIPRGLASEDRLNGNALYQYFGDFPLSFLALHLDLPLVGQRVSDILDCLDFLQDEYPDRDLRVVSHRESVPASLFAAVLDNRVARIDAHEGLVSWESIFSAEWSVDCLSNVAPGILEWADLPDLVQAISPRQVHLHGCRSPEGVLLTRDQLVAVYRTVLGRDPADLNHLTFEEVDDR